MCEEHKSSDVYECAQPEKPAREIRSFVCDDMIVIGVGNSALLHHVHIRSLITFTDHVLMIQCVVHPMIQMMGMEKIPCDEDHDDHSCANGQEVPHGLKHPFDYCRPCRLYSIVQRVKEKCR